MDEQLYLWLGIILFISVVLDIIITTLSPRGAGFISKYIISGVWRFFLWTTGKKGSHQILDYITMIVSVVMLTLWILLLWVSNSLILISDYNSVLTTNHIPASVIEKIYYAGYTLSTLGNGDLIPGSNFWRLYTNLLAFTGLLMITIGITYLVPLLQAEIQRRNLCLHISSLGLSAEDFLIRNWNGEDFSMLSDHFDDLRQEIFYLGQNHTAYPILHHSHSHVKQRSTSITISILDEALTILLYSVPKDHWPKQASLRSLRIAINSYLSTLNAAFIKPSNKIPPLPNYDLLREAGIPILPNDEEIEKCYKRHEPRRKLLMGLLETDGWEWKDLKLRAITIEE